MFGKKFKIWKQHVGYVEPKMELDKRSLIFINESPNKDPVYAHDGDSGFDLRAWIRKDEEGAKVDKKTDEVSITLKPFERRKIHTGLSFILPEFTELQIRPRSGCAIDDGLTVINSPATVDYGYRGEVCILSVNLSNKNVVIKSGERIAQAVLCPVYNSHLVNLEKADSISNSTERGSNGYGSSGKN